MFPSEEAKYLNCDMIYEASLHIHNEDVLYPIEFLNSLIFFIMPNHTLCLKVDTPILLKILNQLAGLYNSTCLIITHMGKWFV